MVRKLLDVQKYTLWWTYICYQCLYFVIMHSFLYSAFVVLLDVKVGTRADTFRDTPKYKNKLFLNLGGKCSWRLSRLTFSLHRPLYRFILQVTMTDCMCVCLCHCLHSLGIIFMFHDMFVFFFLQLGLCNKN